MNQQSLFDQAESEELKEAGMAAGVRMRETDLQFARSIARELCRLQGVTNADEVGRLLYERHGIKTLGPAAGSIFKSSEFEWAGEFVKSGRKTNHSRLLRVWRLKAEAVVNAREEIRGMKTNG